MQTLVTLCRFAVISATCVLPSMTFAQPTYAPTRSYGTSQRQGLDPNYGLPSFGMRGSELPQQKTMATPPEAPSSSALSFLNDDSQTDNDTLDLKPKRPGLASTGETPLFTTPTDTTASPLMPKSRSSDSYSATRPDGTDD